MELKQLQYFLAVTETLNFSRAAELLYTSQPNLSYQIAELEHELGTRLFNRDRRRVSMTPAGGALLPLAQNVIRDTQAIWNLAQQGFPVTVEMAPLSLAYDRTEDHFESTGITEGVARFHKNYPQVQLDIYQKDSGDCVQALLDQKIDMAFLILHHNVTLPPPLLFRPVHRDNLVLVVQDTPDVNTWEQALTRYSLMLVDDQPMESTRARGSNRILKFVKNAGIVPNVITVDSIPVSFTYVQAGIGAMCLPKNYFQLHRYKNLKALNIPVAGAELMHVLAWNRLAHNPSVQLLLNSFPEVRAMGGKDK